MEHLIIDGQEVDINKDQIITISTDDNVTYKIILESMQILTQDTELINRLLD